MRPDAGQEQAGVLSDLRRLGEALLERDDMLPPELFGALSREGAGDRHRARRGKA
jgi:hypothetical protein